MPPACPACDRRLLLLGLGASLLAACDANPTTGRRQLAFVPDEQLARMADEAWAELLATTPATRSEALDRRLAAVAGPIVRATGRTDLDWEFVILERPELNAFVLPNGKVAVFRGMMEFVADDDELAGVIGHEAAHILARHPAERASQELAARAGVALGQAVLGGENGENAGLVAGVLGLGAAYGVLLPYSRAHELEADRLGVKLTRDAGFDPEGAVRFWQRMMARRQGEGQPPEALSTHPADERRLAELEQAVAATA